MDFIRARSDKISVPFTRPQPTDVFTSVGYITDYFYSSYVDDVYVQGTTI